MSLIPRSDIFSIVSPASFSTYATSLKPAPPPQLSSMTRQASRLRQLQPECSFQCDHEQSLSNEETDEHRTGSDSASSCRRSYVAPLCICCPSCRQYQKGDDSSPVTHRQTFS